MPGHLGGSLFGNRSTPSEAGVFQIALNALRNAGAALRRFIRRRPIGAIALGFLLIELAIAILAPAIAPQSPIKVNYGAVGMAPGPRFWLGSDTLGRDVLSRVIYGARVSLLVGFGSVLLGTTVGGIWGLTSGYIGGRFDLFSQRLNEIIMAFPSLILAMVLLVAFGSGLAPVVIAIGITRVPYGVRVVRSVSMLVREQVYVDAARALGVDRFRIIVRHVLPNCLAPYMVLATAHLGAAIVIEASLGFLGLGVPPPTPTWGNMLGAAQSNSLNPLWWLVLFPGLAILCTVLAFNLLGDALRDILDPRLRGAA